MGIDDTGPAAPGPRRGAVIAALAAFAAASAAGGSPGPAHALPRADLAVGQEWSIKATPPSPVRVVIGGIDTLPGAGATVSVSLVGVPTPRGPITVGHVAFEMAALAASLDALVAVGQASPPEFAPAYRQWRADPEGEILAVPVEDVIATIADQMRAVTAPRPTTTQMIP